MVAQRGTGPFPATNPHVEVVALGKDPTVTARDRAKLNHNRASPTLQVDETTGKAALERDSVYTLIGKIE